MWFQETFVWHWVAISHIVQGDMPFKQMIDNIRCTDRPLHTFTWNLNCDFVTFQDQCYITLCIHVLCFIMSLWNTLCNTKVHIRHDSVNFGKLYTCELFKNMSLIFLWIFWKRFKCLHTFSVFSLLTNMIYLNELSCALLLIVRPCMQAKPIMAVPYTIYLVLCLCTSY